MNRQRAERLLGALIFDDLDEASKTELLAYLETDDELRERLADLRMAAKLACDAVNDGPAPVLSQHRLKQLERLAQTGRPAVRVFSARRFMAAAAVLALGLILAGVFVPSLSKVKRYSGRSVAFSGVERQQDALEQSVHLRRGQDADVEWYDGEDIGRKIADGPHSARGPVGVGGMGGYAGGEDGYAMGGYGGSLGGYGAEAQDGAAVASGAVAGYDSRFVGGRSLGTLSEAVVANEPRLAEGERPASSSRVAAGPQSAGPDALELSSAVGKQVGRVPAQAEGPVALNARLPSPISGPTASGVVAPSVGTPAIRDQSSRLPTSESVSEPVTRGVARPSLGLQDESWLRQVTNGEETVYSDAVSHGWSGTVTPAKPSGLAVDTEPSTGPRDGDSESEMVAGLGDTGRAWYYRPQKGSERATFGESLGAAREAGFDKARVVRESEAGSLERAGQPVTTMPALTPLVPANAKSDADSDASGAAKVPIVGDLPVIGGLFKSVGEPPTSQVGGDRDVPDVRWALGREESNQPVEVELKDTPEGLHKAFTEDSSALPSETRFRVVPVNPWVMTEQDAQSTFALDVDTASYALCRRYIRSGYLPPVGAVRMEEFVNAFDYAYPQRDEPTFAVYAEGAPSPFAPAGQDLTLLKIAVKARTVGRDQRRAAHLVFVVDASASMGQADRLPQVQATLSLLVDRLSAGDRVSLVTCANEARLHLEAVSVREKDTIRQTIDAIQSAGPTNLLAGLELGYATARRAFVAGQINQVVLCSDGVANVGEIEADAVLEEVADDRKQGITLTCVGVGYGAYNDAFLEALANHGDGRYVFLDSAPESREALVGHLSDTLQTVAKDARIQVEFNPARVRRYRLIGYENRDIEDQQFRDDTIDAGEVGSGQCSTALYELELTAPRAARDTILGTVFVRYRDTDTDKIEEIAQSLTSSLVRRRSVEADPRFFLAAGAARFAEWLRQSEHARATSLTDVQTLLDEVSVALPLDRDVQDLAALAHQGENLPRAP